MCKIGEKKVCFWSYWRIWKGHEDACKNAYQGSIFIPEKYVFRVCFKSPKPFYEEDIQWRHQNFLWGHRGSKMRFCGGKYPKKLPKMAYFGHFFLGGGGSEGKQNLRLRGEMSLCPLDAATDDIQPEIQVPRGGTFFLECHKVDMRGLGIWKFASWGKFWPKQGWKNLKNSVGPSKKRGQNFQLVKVDIWL